ncbi:MAG TPA: hypothetical protein VK907_11845 [Phnomibacter sp.]|nr:hypothetical protein [Phnomibacter sp.]
MLMLFRILAYLLLVLGFFLGLLTFASLAASLASVAALLPTFICGATVIYIYTSFVFLQQGILGKRALKAGMYDWIRVNGFVALFLASLFIFQSFYFRNNPELNEQLQAQIGAMSEQMPSEQMPDLQKIINWALNFMLISGAILASHVMLCFGYLKKYRQVFSKL